MPKKIHIKNSSLAMRASNDVQELCAPLIELFGPIGFCYHKIFPDGHEICLSENADWIKHLHENNLTVAADLDAFGIKGFDTFLWPFESLENAGSIKNIREIWNCHFGISLSNGKDEFFGFAIKNKTDINVVNNYIHNMAELERFCQYFVEKAENLIQAASRATPLYYSKNQNQPKSLQPSNLKSKFIDATPITYYRTRTGHIKALRFTLRELDCLRLLIRGYTASEIAIILAISIRTVETHLEHIKDKTGVANKGELIRFIFSNQIDKFF
jgi:DNA-binding CsgD family transcriptional regulator